MKQKASFRLKEKCMSDNFFQMFLSSSTYPEIHGYLHAKEQGKKSWKKLYFLLRRSGLYFSTKGTSKVREGEKKKRENYDVRANVYVFTICCNNNQPKFAFQLRVIKREKIIIYYR